jgi:hypothetical protein
MKDRELLELAAKACGWVGVPDKWRNICSSGRNTEWNPLTDDGDALRLAVKLGLALSIENFDGVMDKTIADGALHEWCCVAITALGKGRTS